MVAVNQDPNQATSHSNTVPAPSHSSQADRMNSTTPDVLFTELSPLPQAPTQSRKRKAGTSEVLTSSPYKQALAKKESSWKGNSKQKQKKFTCSDRRSTVRAGKMTTVRKFHCSYGQRHT